MISSASSSNSMSGHQRTVAVGMILIQCFLLGKLMHAIAMAPLFAAAALLGWWNGRSTPMPIRMPFHTRWVLMACGVIFAMKYSFFRKAMPFDLVFVNTPLAYEIASYCLFVQILTLFAQRYRHQLPLWFLVLSIIGMTFTADVRVVGGVREWMIVAIALYLPLWASFAAWSRRRVPAHPRKGKFGQRLSVSVLVASVAIGSFMSTMLHRHERKLEEAVSAYLSLADPGTARAGFSSRGGLTDISSWRTVGSNSIALRVEADRAPGYMRGRVFDKFAIHRWTVSIPAEFQGPRFAQERNDGTSQKDYTFRIAPGKESNESLKVWPIDGETAANFFSPLETVSLIASVDTILLDDNAIATQEENRRVSPYQLVLRDEGVVPVAPISEHFLALPAELDSRISEVADELTRNCTTSREKMDAIREHFQENFTYKLGVQIPTNEDRIGYFLEHRPPAHCEYFATATTLLLRSSGVNARYVTGYLSIEQNNVDGSWLARRKDAHAWVEAYDEETQRWIIVESTPAAGVPVPLQTGLLRQTFDALFQQWRALQLSLETGEFWAWIIQWIRPLAILIFIGVGAIGIWKLLNIRINRSKKAAATPDAVLEIQQTRASMDRYLKTMKLERDPGETILQFAHRIRETIPDSQGEVLADWYCVYNRARYQAQPSASQALAELTSSCRLAMQTHRTGITPSLKANDATLT